MPTIGRDDIELHYTGKDLPKEAREMGGETGEEAGKAHSEAFDDEVRKGFGKTSDDLVKDARAQGGKSGEAGGDAYAKKFGDRLRQSSKKDLEAFGQDLSNLFKKDDGLNDYVKRLDGLDTQFDKVSRAFTEIDTSLDVLRERSQISREEVDRHRASLDKWADSALIDAGIADAAGRKLENYLEKLGLSGKAADDLRLVGDQAKITRKDVDSFGTSVERLGTKLKNSVSGSKSIAALVDGMKGIIRPADDAVLAFDKLAKSVDRSGATVTRRKSAFSGFLNILEAPIKGIESLGSKILGLGSDIDKAGGKAESAGPKFGSLFRAFSQFDPSDNIGQLIALIIAFLPQITVLASSAAAGLVILGGAVSAAALGFGGLVLAFTNLVGKKAQVPVALKGISDALKGVITDAKGLRDTLQENLFDGLEGPIKRLSTTLIPALNDDMKILGGALNNVLKQWLTDLESSNFADTLNQIFTGLAPVIEDLGQIVSNVFGIIGQLILDTTGDVKDFTGGIKDATGDFLSFLKSPEGHKEVHDWVEDSKRVLGQLGESIGEVAGALGDLVDPKNIDDTVQSIKNIGDAAKSFTELGNQLGSVATSIIGAIKGIAQIFTTLGAIIDPVLTGIEVGFVVITGGANRVFQAIAGLYNTIISPFQLVMTSLEAVGKALGDLASGNFAGAVKDIQSGNKAIQDAFSKTGSAVASAFGNDASYFDTFDKKSQTALSNVATNFGLTGDRAKEFGGILGEAAQSGGVSLQSLAKDKSLDDLASSLGITRDAAQVLFGTFVTESQKGQTALDKLKASATSNLTTVEQNMGATGKAAGALTTAFLNTAGDSKAAIAGLAGARSWADVENALAGAGSAAKTKMADNIIAAAQASGVKIDSLPPKIQALIAKYGEIPKNVKTDVTVSGIQSATSLAADLTAKLKGIPDIQRTVTIITEQRTDPGKARNSVGGLIAGGMQIAGGQKFAAGGIISQPTWFGNSLAGEAGPEAIVPLTGALSSVDKSVRGLAAYARGQVGSVKSNTQATGVGAGTTVAAGAIVVNEAGNGQTTAAAVLDRLVANL